MKKKLVSILLSVLLCFSAVGVLAACGDPGGGITLKVWASQEDQAMLSEMAAAYKKDNPDVTISLSTLSEPDVQTKLQEDADAGADVFHMASDHVSGLQRNDLLYEVTKNKESIISNNSSDSIAAATINNKLYAYPYDESNGYFLYYDKRVLTADDVVSVDKIITKLKTDTGNHKFLLNMEDSFYLPAYFFTNGGKIVDGNPIECNFDSDNGVKAAQALLALKKSAYFVSGNDSVVKSGFKGDGTTHVGAAVSGTWNAKDLTEILGENLGVAKLPTDKIGGVETQLSGFKGFKLVGINARTKQPVEAMKFAEYITSKEAQIKRATDRGIIPTHKDAVGIDVVKNDPIRSAFVEQAQYSEPQIFIPTTFWLNMESFGKEMYSGTYDAYTTAQFKTKLTDVVKNITTKV